MTTRHIPLDERIIFALDFASPETAKAWVERLEGPIRFFKVGLQLFLAGHFDIVDWIIKRGHKVMLDLKFFDVPETVKLAVRQVRDRGVSFATIHGNDPIIRAAVAEKGDLNLLAVTVLTSFDESDLRAMGLTGSVEELVQRRARKALDLGCDGVVSSGWEAERLRADFGDKFFIVTPGIRPGANVEAPEDDQKRIMTAERALSNGADHVVVGRPISRAADPLAVVEAMRENIRLALPGRV